MKLYGNSIVFFKKLYTHWIPQVTEAIFGILCSTAVFLVERARSPWTTSQRLRKKKRVRGWFLRIFEGVVLVCCLLADGNWLMIVGVAGVLLVLFLLCHGRSFWRWSALSTWTPAMWIRGTWRCTSAIDRWRSPLGFVVFLFKNQFTHVNTC